jgi:Response regulator receiver domain
VYGNVLIVEDEDALRCVIAANLRRRGHRVREAATAREAIAALLDECPDLLLLDINLPDHSGWDVAREMRARSRRSDDRGVGRAGRGESPGRASRGRVACCDNGGSFTVRFSRRAPVPTSAPPRPGAAATLLARLGSTWKKRVR